MKHAKDRNGKQLAIGHHVLIPAKIVNISPTPGQFDTKVLLDETAGLRERTEVILNSSQVEVDHGHPQPEITIAQAMNRIKKAFNEEPAKGPGSYRHSFLCNISMPILDQREKLDLKTPEGADAMAEILLNHLFGEEVPEPERHQVADAPHDGKPDEPINPPAGEQVKDSNV
jgi:hypothetical protein